MRPWVAAAVTVAVDQLSKLLVQQTMAPGQSIPLLPPVLHLSYVQNTGMAFGLLQGFPYLFVILAVVIAAAIVRELLTARRPWWMEIALGLILGGAIGNLIDRVRFGHVVDFIDLRVWPVFNVADSAITIGVTILVLESCFGRRPSSGRP